MVGRIDTEQAVNAWISIVSGAMAAKVAALNAEYDDGIVLETLQDYWRSPMGQYPSRRYAVVVGSTTEAAAERQYRKDVHSILAQIVYGDNLQVEYEGRVLTPAEVAGIKLERTYRAIREIIETGDNVRLTIDGVPTVDRCFFMRFQRIGLNLPDDEAMFFRGGIIEFAFDTSVV